LRFEILARAHDDVLAKETPRERNRIEVSEYFRFDRLAHAE
jgi:hypothetical protein